MKGNPIKLLKTIKQHALNFQDRRYEMSVILEAMRTIITIRQRDNEILQDYTKQFKTSQEVMESHIGGPIELAKFMSAMKGYGPSDMIKAETYKIKAYNQLMAYIYMDNADH